MEVASEALRQGDVTSPALVMAALDRIERLDPVLHAFTSVFREQALETAARLQLEIDSGAIRGHLHGIPIGVKDVIDYGRTTAGSRHWADRVAPRPAPVVIRLEEAGAVIVGKTATYEFAVGRPTADSYFPAAANPWNPSIDPGGSSSGSAVAVAAGMVFSALGTDSGGSIRYPSFACGVFGMKPTYGYASRVGVFPFTWSLDTVGVHARTATDAALVLEVCRDADDDKAAMASRRDIELSRGDEADLRGLRIGVPRGFYALTCDPEIASAVDTAITMLQTLGARARTVEIPTLPEATATFWIEALAAFAAIHRASHRRDPEGYGHSVRLLLETGLLVDGWAHVQALRARSRIRREVLATLATVDVLVLPTVGAFPGPLADEPDGSNVLSEDETGYTHIFNLAGIPALAVPIGLGSSGLPVGFQVAGRPWSEPLLFRVGHAYSTSNAWNREPPIVH
jgi:aspartyl-tRNA(Asn)/glutamyl-tRNA(Gln) amidotransferase subunit A